MSSVVATANILCALRPAAAGEALRVVLDSGPDLVCLQEWSWRRRRLLRGTGYHWVAPLLGGCPVGARAGRYDLVESSTRLLAGPGRSDRGARPLPVAPARLATVAVVRDRDTGDLVSVVSFHLTPGVQRRGVYRADRPHLVGRHRRETATLERLVAEQQRLGRTVHAGGDSNLHGFRLAGLTSAWDGDAGKGLGGSLGRRRIDDVHGPGPALDVRLLDTPSDHRAVVVRRA